MFCIACFRLLDWIGEKPCAEHHESNRRLSAKKKKYHLITIYIHPYDILNLEWNIKKKKGMSVQLFIIKLQINNIITKVQTLENND